MHEMCWNVPTIKCAILLCAAHHPSPTEKYRKRIHCSTTIAGGNIRMEKSVIAIKVRLRPLINLLLFSYNVLHLNGDRPGCTTHLLSALLSNTNSSTRKYAGPIGLHRRARASITLTRLCLTRIQQNQGIHERKEIARKSRAQTHRIRCKKQSGERIYWQNRWLPQYAPVPPSLHLCTRFEWQNLFLGVKNEFDCYLKLGVYSPFDRIQ